jgi:hypothetical protein
VPVSRTIILSLAGFVLAVANWRVPVLRFAWQPANLATFMLAMLLPAVPVVVAIRRARWGVASALSLAAFLGAILAVGAGVLCVDALWNGTDPSFEPVREVPAGPYALRVYRTNGGATTSFGAIVRQERTLVLGLRLVRNVYTAYPAEDARIAGAGPNRWGFDGRDPITLRPHIWY